MKKLLVFLLLACSLQAAPQGPLTRTYSLTIDHVPPRLFLPHFPLFHWFPYWP